MKSGKSSRYYRRELRSASQTYSSMNVLTMAMSKKTVMAIKSYQSQAEVLVKNYLLSDPFIPYTSILGGIFLCKLVCSYLISLSIFIFIFLFSVLLVGVKFWDCYTKWVLVFCVLMQMKLFMFKTLKLVFEAGVLTTPWFSLSVFNFFFLLNIGLWSNPVNQYLLLQELC